MKLCIRSLVLLVSILLLGSVWSVMAEVSPEQSADLMVEQWVGHEFLFLALPADKQSEGYEIFPEGQAEQGFQGDRSVRVPYVEYFARRVIITKVVPTSDAQFDYIVYMTEKETGQRLAGRTMYGQLDGLALNEDRENARELFVSKTIYAKRRTLNGVYDPLTKTVPVSVTVPLGTPMKVIDVWDGIQSSEPIWLVVSVNGKEAALPITYSWTNQQTNAWKVGHPWQRVLFIQDPYSAAGASEEIWNLIEAGDIKEGMTKNQVRLAWGLPLRIEEENSGSTATSLWIYPTNKLKFTEDNLSFIETIEGTN